MPEAVTLHRVIHRGEGKDAVRQEFAPGTRIDLGADHMKHLASRGAIASPAAAEAEAVARAEAENPLAGVAQPDPGLAAEQKAAEEAAAKATADAGGVSRAQPTAEDEL